MQLTTTGENVKILSDKLIIRITKENRESIYSKEITRVDGSKTRLYINIPVKDEVDERSSSLMVQTAIVEGVGEGVDWISVGDTALINYDVCNDNRRLLYKENGDSVYFLEVYTTYHENDLIAYQTRKSRRDQIVHSKGDINEQSVLLGIIKNDRLIANDPFVFFEDISNVVSKVSAAGILYEETQKIYQRKILAVSRRSTERFGIKEGDIVYLDDRDTFVVKLDKDNTIGCINDSDILLKKIFI